MGDHTRLLVLGHDLTNQQNAPSTYITFMPAEIVNLLS